jgi:hypothetical protein
MSKIIDIKSIFIIKKNEKSEVKEMIDIKIIDIGYKDFLS